jgi:hypothetical protein
MSFSILKIVILVYLFLLNFKYVYLQDRDILKCINHASKVSTGFLYSQITDSSTLKFRGYIERSGLFTLVDCSYRYANKLAVLAFIERSQLETNTFHVPFVEMTITIDDVYCILGIPINSRSVSADSV